MNRCFTKDSMHVAMRMVRSFLLFEQMVTVMLAGMWRKMASYVKADEGADSPTLENRQNPLVG